LRPFDPRRRNAPPLLNSRSYPTSLARQIGVVSTTSGQSPKNRIYVAAKRLSSRIA
jgi:hypothetical protein